MLKRRFPAKEKDLIQVLTEAGYEIDSALSSQISKALKARPGGEMRSPSV